MFGEEWGLCERTGDWEIWWFVFRRAYENPKGAGNTVEIRMRIWVRCDMKISGIRVMLRFRGAWVGTKFATLQ